MAAMFLAVFLAVLCACAPKVKLAPAVGSSVPRAVALLPGTFPDWLRAERREVIELEFLRALQESGYIVADPQLVSGICGAEGDCLAGRDQLRDHLQVKGFLQLKIASSAKRNFLAGYVDDLRGTAVLQDAAGGELAVIDHTEIEQGGLLFNSGQVLTGVESSLENYGDPGFRKLARRFAEAVVKALPTPQHSESGISAPQITKVEAARIGPERLSVCVAGENGVSASLRIGGESFPLSMPAPGMFCGYVWSRLLPLAMAQVELRSPFGTAARAPLPLNSLVPCSAEKLILVAIQPASQGHVLKISCAAEGVKSFSECQPVPGCGFDSVEVYQAPRPSGPYRKLRRLAAPTELQQHAEGGSAPIYQVVIAGDGARTPPISPIFAAEVRR